MDDLSLLIDLHRGGARQGPGGAAETRLAIALSGLDRLQGKLKIADIGCGTGASTLILAEALDAGITALDAMPEFLEELESAATRTGLDAKIRVQAGSMETFAFDDASLDAIWSEGAIYNMGFANGIRAWRRYLKPGGILAVSELTWLTHARPAELGQHWQTHYPEVATASAKIALLEGNGYAPLGYFPLPEKCWLDNYYRPMQARFPDFLSRHDHSASARAVIAAEEAEISLYERFSGFFGYGFYIAARTAG